MHPVTEQLVTMVYQTMGAQFLTWRIPFLMGIEPPVRERQHGVEGWHLLKLSWCCHMTAPPRIHSNLDRTCSLVCLPRRLCVP